MTRANPTPRLRAAAYCRIVGGEEQSAILELQKTCYTERIGANPDWIMAAAPSARSSRRCFAGAGRRRST